MALLVVSDMHIHGPDDPLYRSLLTLLSDRAKPRDVAVLAGDLFDLFVGNKRIFLDRYSEFMKVATDAGARGVKIHYIEGNHDFLIKKAFASIPNLTVHPESVSETLSGKRFLVSHGDTFDRSDIGYRALRIFYRSPVMRTLVKLAPGKWLDWYGQSHSAYSRNSKPRLPSELPIEKLERLRRVYRSFAAEQIAQGFDYVIAGHCHDLDEFEIQVGGRKGQYINVGYPRAHGSYLYWEPGEEKVYRQRLPS